MTALLRRTGWFAHWLLGAALALLIGASVAGWIWAGQDGSLPRVLGWAQALLHDPESTTGRLQAVGAQGSLRRGGTVQTLRWTGLGLDIQAHGLTLRWHSAQLVDALLLRRLQIDTLHLAHLQVDNQRPPVPDETLQAIELPLPVDLPWALDRLQLSGRQNLQLDGLRGHYRYRPVQASDHQAWGQDGAALNAAVTQTHHLQLDAVTLAQGQYQAEVVLGAQAPLPLHLAAVGRIQAVVPKGERLDLQAVASAHGHLAGSSAVLDVQAHVLPKGAEGIPTLKASARVLPNAAQPLRQVQAQAHALNLALLWPRAPVTALSGQLQATTEGDTWRVQLDLRNTRSGPWDQQRLPLDRLQARIEQDGPLWRLTGLQAMLGAGQLQGSGRYRAPADGQPAQWQGELTARAIDPARLWSALAPARWNLQASVRQSGGQTDSLAVDARLQGAGDSGGGLRLRELRLLGQWHPSTAGGELHIDEARLEAAQATLAAHGVLNLSTQRFDGGGTLQLPGAQGQINGVLAADNGQGSLDLKLDAIDRLLAWLHDLRRLPLVGQPLAQALDATPLLRVGSLAGQAQLQARWQGGLFPLGLPLATRRTGQPGTVPLQVQWRLDVPNLSAKASETTAGWSLRDAQLQADGGPQDLALQLRGQVAQGPWAAAVQVQGRAQGWWPWPDARAPLAQLQLQTLHLRATDTRRPEQPTDWTLRSTQPLTFSAHGSGHTLALQAAPAQLQLQRQASMVRQTRSPAPASAAPPEPSTLMLAWDKLVWQAGALQTRGRLVGLSPDWLTAATGEQLPSLTGDLLLDGAWDLYLPWQTATPPRLLVQLQRRSGDLLLRTDALDSPRPGSRSSPSPARSDSPPSARLLDAGVREARLELSVQDAKLQTRLRWDSERLGELRADLTSTVAASPGSQDSFIDRWWPASTPWQGSLSARLPQLSTWSALAPPGWRMRGTLQLDATLGGSRAQPDWRGTLQADQLALRSVVDGFEFSQGQLRASLSGERITIDRFDLQGPLGGSLSATGQAQWPLVNGRHQPQIGLQLVAQQLRLSSRADRRLTISGQANAQLVGPQLTIRGQFKADTALFVLPDETTPSLGTDVVVRGGRNLSPETESAAIVRPDVLVQLDLGPQFDVRGRGLQARLSGQLELRSTPARPTPRVFGVVSTVNGSYRAYGQQLQLETGELSFNGPFDDPALKILAIRPMARSTEQQVGVQISGSAQAPRVRLVATPELPDAEKLAWLVLGRPATSVGAEAAILQQAALALLAGNDDSLNSGLAGALGLDELSVRSESVNTDGSTRAATVTLGKRISSRLYLGYETGLAGAMGTVSVFYDLSRRLTLRAQAGQESAVDLIFKISHD